jgi:hypothetical protein
MRNIQEPLFPHPLPAVADRWRQTLISDGACVVVPITQRFADSSNVITAALKPLSFMLLYFCQLVGTTNLVLRQFLQRFRNSGVLPISRLSILSKLSHEQTCKRRRVSVSTVTGCTAAGQTLHTMRC